MLGSETDVRRSINAAAVAELAWSTAAGAPAARPVTPLWLADRPAVALPYADLELAREVAAAPAVALVVSDPRLGGSGWCPVAVTGRPRLVADPEGARFTADLLEQELRKFPPARALIDSPLLRREHWWYLPRLILTVEPVEATPVPARRDWADELLAVATGAGSVWVDTVWRHGDPGAGADGGPGADRFRVASPAGRSPPAGPALLLGHDFSIPDLERWTPWCTSGQLVGQWFTVRQRPARTTLEPVPGLWRRLRRHRALARACRRALAREESAGSGSAANQ